ncbi:Leucine-rich repeat domain superfamily [Sesbania bispinosa]|nr:Leucine-rich repeat domain superfamily [Sesbania bispinosa]
MKLLHSVLVFAFSAICVFSLISVTQAQANATTDPAEVRALNTVFQKWNISAPSNKWNISGEPCSGVAIDNTSLDDDEFGVLIKCECQYQNGTTCHITQLNLNQNYLTGPLSPSIGKQTSMQYL